MIEEICGRLKSGKEADLWMVRRPVVIDFPQVVGAAHNNQAESFFQRDLENLRRFFEAIDPSLRAAANDAREI